MDEKEKNIPDPADLLMEEPLLAEEPVGPMQELILEDEVQSEVVPEEVQESVIPAAEEPEESDIPAAEETEASVVSVSEEAGEPVILAPEEAEDPVILVPEEDEEPVILAPEEAEDPVILVPEEDEEPVILAPEEAEGPVILVPEDAPVVQESPADANMPESWEDTIPLPDLDILMEEIPSEWDAPADEQDPFFTPAAPAPQPAPEPASRYHAPRKGRPKRKKGYGLFGLPHLIATCVWLGIIVMIGTSLGRMLWVCAADVLAFGRESKKVSVTITSNDTIDDIAGKLHDAELIRYPELFKLYASLAVDDGDILPGTFEMDTLYDYHALVVQMGPRSSTREIVEDLLIPEGLNCRQIFELLEQNNVCSVAELEEYAANGEFADFWFLEGVERGDRYCLEGFLFPDTYDFYMNSTPREALGKMLLGFQARVDQEQTMAALAALNERLSGMMRDKGCSEAHIAENQLSLRDLLTVASLIEEETGSTKESPIIASVIFNRLTEDQMYERYLGIDAALIYATGDADNIDTSIDHPYNTYKNAGLTPSPISNPGLDSIYAALEFEDTPYYYYVLNPETGLSDFSKTREEHEQKVEQYYGGSNG